MSKYTLSLLGASERWARLFQRQDRTRLFVDNNLSPRRTFIWFW